MDDVISRSDAIDAVISEPLYESGMKKRDADTVIPAIYEKIKLLPPAQSEPTFEQIEEYCRKRCLVIMTYELYYEMTRRWSSAQPETQWTLCRDKEPAEELNCWFTANNCYGYRYVEKGMFTSRYGRQMEKGFITTFGHFVRWESVLAWTPMVMPEPWEGE